MNPELEETIYADFITSSPTTGAAIDADATPTCEVFKDANDTAILAPMVTKRTGKLGNYRVQINCLTVNGFEAGKSFNVIVSAVVGGVAAKRVLQTFQIRTNGADDLAASILTRAAPGAAMTLTPAYDSAKLAANQASVDALAVVSNKLNTAMEIDGAVYRFTVNALEQAPISVSMPDWTAIEKDQIRFRLGIDGNSNVPSAAPTLADKPTVDSIKFQTDKFSFAGSDVRATLDGELVELTSDYDAAKEAQQAGPVTLDPAYDAAKTAANQASMDDVKLSTDHLATAMVQDGSVYQFTANALELAPTGGDGPIPPPNPATGDNPATTVGPTTEPPVRARRFR